MSVSHWVVRKEGRFTRELCCILYALSSLGCYFDTAASVSEEQLNHPPVPSPTKAIGK